jgi:hypothetical protein
MSQNNIPLAAWPGYVGKAERLLKNIEHPEELAGWAELYRIVIPRENEWWQLGKIPNVGAKMLRWMVEHRMLERRFYSQGQSVESILQDWYRMPQHTKDFDEDFGELWIA